MAKGIKPKSFNAVIPVLIIVFGTLGSLFYTGWDAQVWNDDTMGFFDKLSTTIGNADSFKALLWSSLLSLFSAIVLTISQKLLDLKDTMESVIAGFKTMLPAVMILVLAWSVALDHRTFAYGQFYFQSFTGSICIALPDSKSYVYHCRVGILLNRQFMGNHGHFVPACFAYRMDIGTTPGPRI